MSETNTLTPGIARHAADSDCFCYAPEDGCGCACGPEEKALRIIAWAQPCDPMTPDDREWCLREIERVEGHTRADHLDDSDGQLARAVLDAWTDYCRDKGLM